MWMYDKKLEYPIKIANSNPALAKLIITQYGGPDANRLCNCKVPQSLRLRDFSCIINGKRRFGGSNLVPQKPDSISQKSVLKC